MTMRRIMLTLAGGLAIAILGACTSDSEADEATATPTATVTAVPTESATPEATPTEAVESDAGQVLAALLLIDGAGFHGMDETLNGDTPAIEASWLGAVTRANTAAQAIAWPADLQGAADAFIEAATSLAAALEADDAAAAAAPATAAHETQHDLSHAAYEVIAAAPASASDTGAILAALSLIDGAGFHGMDETLNGDAPAIEAAWVGRTERARIAAQAIAWPTDLQGAADAFIAAAEELEGALNADDAAAAAAPATAAHETQHDLSHDAWDALVAMAASDDSPGAILAALSFIDGAGFHGMDDALNGAAPAIEASWLGATTRARVAAQAVAWPAGLQPAATAFIEAAQALEAALEADDAAGGAPLATAAHDTQHDLSHDAYASLGGDSDGH